MNKQDYAKKIRELAYKGEFEAARQLSKKFHAKNLKQKLDAR